MASWIVPPRPAAYVEQALVSAILDGTFPPGSTLPGERELAERLGVTRPTLRETLRRLERDGWVTIRQGKPTRVNDFWRDGGLNALHALVRYAKRLPPSFVPNLLEVRVALAPAYARAAVERNPEQVLSFLAASDALEDTPDAFAAYDWQLHRTLAMASGNPVFTLILNGFAGFYERMARLYFAQPEARKASRTFYNSLRRVALRGDGVAAQRITRRAMRRSLSLWEKAQGKPSDELPGGA
ncbi:MAG: fatty acid metabolism transcriptional regulator FadR [Chloroflexia bacterium]